MRGFFVFLKDHSWILKGGGISKIRQVKQVDKKRDKKMVEKQHKLKFNPIKNYATIVYMMIDHCQEKTRK